MRKYSTLLFILITLFAYSQNQKITFNILHNGKELGVLEAFKEVEGNKITYKNHTDIEYNLLAIIKIVCDYTVVYVDNIMQSSKVHISVRGQDKALVRTVRKGNKNEYYSEGKLKKVINGVINNSLEKLFFEEPVGISSIYVEEHGEFHSLKKTGMHTYLKTAPNGRENTYFYIDGILKKADIDTGVIEFSIVRN